VTRRNLWVKHNGRAGLKETEMLAGKGVLAIATAAMLTLAACSDGAPHLMNLRPTGNGPDEFSILPPKALEMPKNLVALPEPTPGEASLTDPTPEADAIVALGGRPGKNAGVPRADNGLLTHASRFGSNAGIREDLAASDLKFRRANKGRVLERLFNVSVYYRVYLPQSLDQRAELQRWRRAGVRTVSAPPPQKGE